MKKLVLLFIVLASCATQKNVVSEEMLPDGVTWVVQINYANRCSSYNESSIGDLFSQNAEKEQQKRLNKCVEELKPALMIQGKELCGRIPIVSLVAQLETQLLTVTLS